MTGGGGRNILLREMREKYDVEETGVLLDGIPPGLECGVLALWRYRRGRWHVTPWRRGRGGLLLVSNADWLAARAELEVWGIGVVFALFFPV